MHILGLSAFADEITATFHYGEGRTVSQSYSVAQYVKDFDAVHGHHDARGVLYLGHQGKEPTLREAVAGHVFDWNAKESKVADVTFDLTLDSSTTLQVFLPPTGGL